MYATAPLNVRAQNGTSIIGSLAGQYVPVISSTTAGSR